MKDRSLLLQCPMCKNEFEIVKHGLDDEEYTCHFCKTKIKLSTRIKYIKSIVECKNKNNTCFSCKYYEEKECSWDYGEPYGYCKVGKDYGSSAFEKRYGMICDCKQYERM